MTQSTKPKSALLTLKNVGPATLHDLNLLGIEHIEQLKDKNPDELYERIQQITGTKHDPCVWDVFAAIIHEAKTGEKLPWWRWSRVKAVRVTSFIDR